MSHHLPSITALSSFRVAYRLGSLAKAAAKQHQTPQAVGYQIRMLEELFGRPLFARTPKGNFPTDFADRIYPDVCALLELAQNLMQRAHDPAERESIRILATQSFASLWLMPKIPELLERFSDLKFEVIGWMGGFSQTGADIAPANVDVEIRYAMRDELPNDLEVERIAQDVAVPICTPEYLAGLVGADVASMLAGATVVHARNWPGIWGRWCEGALGTAIETKRELHFQSTALSIQAALSGVGIAIAHLPLVAEDMRAGRLVPVHAYRLAMQEGYYAIHGGSLSDRQAFFADFVAWCRQRMEFPGPDSPGQE